jgi:UDP-N-acetyl-D-glucosamine dehydrogenase
MPRRLPRARHRHRRRQGRAPQPRRKLYQAHQAADIARARERGFEATTDFTRAGEPDALIICVPTPLNAYREPDLSFVLDTADALLPFMRPARWCRWKAPPTPAPPTKNCAAPGVARLHRRRDVFLVFSPEREDPGNPDFHTRTIPKVCGGVTPACLEAGVALYSPAIDQRGAGQLDPRRRADQAAGEHPPRRQHRPGQRDEDHRRPMDIDIHEVIRAAATKPFGFTPYYPGPGLGGHCIPIDPFYLTWKARQYGLHTRFIELAGEINSDMPHWVIGKLTDALNERGARSWAAACWCWASPTRRTSRTCASRPRSN